MKKSSAPGSSKAALIFLCSGFFISQCSRKPAAGSEEFIRSATMNIDDNYLVNVDKHPENWVTYGRNYSENRFSSLTGINKTNISELSLAWALELGTKRGIEATPLVADGIMFLTSTWSVVHAINIRSGKMIWTHDPKVPRATGEKACCDVVNRGVAIYEGSIFAGTLDGRLIALDAATGAYP